jgi:hypothetical protein
LSAQVALLLNSTVRSNQHLEKHAKDQATAVMAIISNVEDTTLHLALADMTGHPFHHLPHVLYKTLVMYATKINGTAHDLLLDEQRDSMIEANEPLLIYLARHLAIHARLLEASAPNTSISNTTKAIVRGFSRSGQHAFAYVQISLKPPTSMAEISDIFTKLQPSVEALARHTSAMNADAGLQPRRERDRQQGHRPLCNYPRPEGRLARLKWCRCTVQEAITQLRAASRQPLMHKQMWPKYMRNLRIQQ